MFYSVLYADIVNFTSLAGGITAAELVTLLNELFGRFDKLAHEHACTRIKILGDCYYCVSGIPTSTPRHATNCVEMGLAMIKVIKDMREATGSTVDMRIGIHTGFVLSGVIGLKKWQYDVWSNDASIANYLESTGVPGKIHVSETTLKELDKDYQVESNTAIDSHSYFSNKRMKTFLITPQATCTCDVMKNGCTGDAVKRSQSSQGHDAVTKFKDVTGAANAFKSISLFLAQCGIVSKPFARCSQDKSTAERLLGESLGHMYATMSVFNKPFQRVCRHRQPQLSAAAGGGVGGGCDGDELGWWGLFRERRREWRAWRGRDKLFLPAALLVGGVYALLAMALLFGCLLTWRLTPPTAPSPLTAVCVFSLAVLPCLLLGLLASAVAVLVTSCR